MDASIQCSPCLEFISDSGAGRTVFSRQAVHDQDPTLQWQTRSPSECLEFVTANGSTNPVGETTLSTSFGCLNAYELASPPFAVSMGQLVSQGCPFIWVDSEKPFHVKPDWIHELKISVPEDAKIYADRVDQFVPVFRDTVHFETATAAAASRVRSGKWKDMPEGESDEWVMNAPHQLCHFPHDPSCETCVRAHMKHQQTAKKRPAVVRGLGAQLCAPCQELSTDTIIMSKGHDDRRMSSDGALYVHTIRDKYSGLSLAVPQHSKSVEAHVANFRKFCGPRNSSEILLKSDAASELLGAVEVMGWHSEASLANRWPHNAAHERYHGSLKDAVRAIAVQSGFPESAWHLLFPYAATALSITQLAPIYEWERDAHGALKEEFAEKDNSTCWEVHHGESFEGPLEAFGRLCYYKSSSNQHPAAANTVPGLFAGWRLENGLRFRGVCYILDYAQAVEGNMTHLKSVPSKEIMFPSELVFPFAVAKAASLRTMSSVEVTLPFDAAEQSEAEDPAEDETPPPPPPVSYDDSVSRSFPPFKITADRWAAHGSTPGCSGCAALEEGRTASHSKACRERFAGLLGIEAHASPVVYEDSGVKALKAPPDVGCALPPHCDQPGAIVFNMAEYTSQAVELYRSLSGEKKLKAAATPFPPDGSLLESDDAVEGVLASQACRMLMKALWLARLARPDLSCAIGLLATHMHCWSRNDDRRLHRLVCYMNSSVYKLQGHVHDEAGSLKLLLYVDADFAGSSDNAKSTSGGYLVLAGPNSWFPLSWISKRQSAVARSTTEAEVVSLAVSLHTEAIPMQDLMSLVLGRRVPLVILEDNQATIKVIRKGFSAKLRSVPRMHKVSVSSIKEILEDPEHSIELQYCQTDFQAADVFTKALAPQKWDNAMNLLGMVQSGSPSSNEVAVTDKPSSKPDQSSLPKSKKTADVPSVLGGICQACGDSIDGITESEV